MKKKLISAILVLLLTVSLYQPAAAVSFSDITNHWAREAIETWTGYKVLNGHADGTFKPDGDITRAEMAMMLNNLFKYTSKAENTFQDIPDSAWYTDAILKASKAGILRVGDGGYIKPNEKITRQEAAWMVARAFSITGTGGSLSFPDSADVASWALDAVTAMTQAGYLNGYSDGRLYPNANLTRAQSVKLLDNVALRVYGSGDILTKSGRLRTFGAWYNIYDNLPVNTYADTGLFSSENGVMSYTSNGSSALLGIDVSQWQKDIDWAKVAASGVEFAMIRLGNRWSMTGAITIDDYFLKNIEGALANGIDVGVYFFSQAITEEEAVEEARFTLDKLAGWDITYPVVFDWEPVDNDPSRRTYGITKSMLNKCAIAFCDTIAEAGYTPMVYTNKWYGMAEFDLSLFAGYDLWFAGYNTSYPTLYYEMDMWQFTSSGKVDGISGSVDMNLCFVDYPSGAPRF